MPKAKNWEYVNCEVKDCTEKVKLRKEFKLVCKDHKHFYKKCEDCGELCTSRRKGKILCRPCWLSSKNLLINNHGYVSVYLPSHPNSTSQGRILQHRLVMSEILGRPLLSNENVHHINGVKTDNRPENLELWITTQPSGQRPEDLIAWAKEILETYDK